MESSRGFTLLELIIVLIIIAILSVYAMPHFSSTINLVGTAQQFIDDVRLTQSLSMAKNERYYLIGTSGSTYEIRDPTNTPLIRPNGQTFISMTNATFGSVTALPNGIIAFDGRGTPYTDANPPATSSLLLLTASIQIVDSSNNIKTIYLSPFTGNLILQ